MAQLVPDWRNWWRWWSVRLVALGAVLEVFADAVPSALMAITPALSGHIDPEHVRILGYAALAAGIAARVIRQPKLDSSRHVPPRGKAQ